MFGLNSYAPNPQHFNYPFATLQLPFLQPLSLNLPFSGHRPRTTLSALSSPERTERTNERNERGERSELFGRWFAERTERTNERNEQGERNEQANGAYPPQFVRSFVRLPSTPYC